MRRHLTVTLCGLLGFALCAVAQPPGRDAMKRDLGKDALAEFVGPPYHEAPDDPFVAHEALLGERVTSPGDPIVLGPYVSVQVNVDLRRATPSPTRPTNPPSLSIRRTRKKW